MGENVCSFKGASEEMSGRFCYFVGRGRRQALFYTKLFCSDVKESTLESIRSLVYFWSFELESHKNGELMMFL